MARVTFKVDRRAVRRLLNSRTAERAVTDPGERVLAGARAAAPVRTGRYRNSLRLEVGRTDRVVARVGSDVEYAVYLEAELGILSRALRWR